MATPELYQKLSFNDFARQTFFGDKELNRRQTRKLNRYLNSEQGLAAALAHEKRESQKYLDSWDARFKAHMDALNASHNTLKEELTKNLNDYKASVAAGTNPIAKEGAVEDPWLTVAKKYNFNSLDEVKTWQQQNGLAADGKFGKQSLAKWNALKNPTEQKPELVSKTEAQQTTPITEEQFRNNKHFRNHYSSYKTVNIDGTEYPVMVTTGLDKNNEYGLKNDQSYAFDPKTGMIRELGENWMGNLTGNWGNDSWTNINSMFADNSTDLQKAEQAWLTANPRPSNPHTYTQWQNNYYAAKNAGFKKQGGTMRTKYFQQGGAAPQQDMQQQVIALVQAAMQGDQKATDTVNKIMEAAKAGDQQAMQIAQMIQAVAEQMQGQATAAKWGAKLNYIRSLKYAKGGKTCPTCNQKIEMKACGGKKAKKRYFGGWL